MSRVKLWESRDWLYKKYVREHLSEPEIAKLSGASQPTINRWLRKFGLKK